jgi:CRP-like cAMP-binding protein
MTHLTMKHQSIPGSGITPESIKVSELIERALPNAQPETHRVLAQTARTGQVVPDQIIFRQGEGIPLTLVVRGHGAFRRTTVDGRQLVLGLVAGGDMFGFSSIASRPATVDLVALTTGEVATWSGSDLRPLAAGDSGLAMDVIDGMSRYMVNTIERVDGFIHQDARRRVLRVLAEYEDLIFGPSAVLSRTHLPGLVGTSREMTGRVLRRLEREGLIARVGRRGLKLLSPAGLHQAVASVTPESS